MTADSGCWFFGPANVEVIVKILDACAPPFERYWVFAAGLTDVEARLTVLDTQGHQRRTYHNAPGSPFQPIQDSAAFATCP
jgi:hypothetical protein